MTSHIDVLIASFSNVFNSQIRGIFEVEFVLRSSPYKAWTGTDRSAFHVYDINGDLVKIIPVRRGMIIKDPKAAGIAAAWAAIENW